jgi:hypothetical protein
VARVPAFSWKTGELLLLLQRAATAVLRGPRPDLSPPRVSAELLDGAGDSLRATNTFGIRIRCSEGSS